MKQIAWFLVSSMVLTAGLVACSSDSTPGVQAPNTGAGAGGDGQGGDGQAGDGQGGDQNSAGGSKTGGSGGTGQAGENPFGGPGAGGGPGKGGMSAAGNGQGGNSAAGNGAGGAAMGCGIQSQNASCNTCLEAQCCTEGNDCGSAMSCLPFLKCAAAAKCQDQACLDDCGAKNPGGEEPALALNTCLATNCKAECSGGGSAGSGGGTGQSCGVMFGKPTCDTCLGMNCCTEGQACADEPTFATFNMCGAACKDQACIDACAMASPKGAAAYQALIQCLGTGCKAECGL
jgi:hypothetical protein